jgi:hypothetical protein
VTLLNLFEPRRYGLAEGSRIRLKTLRAEFG